MSWRVVVISKRCKLEYRLGYLVCRGEETKKIFLEEISTLLVESTAVAITTALLCELTKNKVNVVFCDEKHNPLAQMSSLQGRYNASGKLRQQILWCSENKQAVWTKIIADKIKQQALFLSDLKQYEKANMLFQYMSEIEVGDATNREGHAAKIYFNCLFGLSFKRGDDTFFNNMLNYGYAIILSAFNREIVAQGYSTQLGIAHKNEFNSFNLACDLMEPFRIIVDRFVLKNNEIEDIISFKRNICNLLNACVSINGQKYFLDEAIRIYCISVLDAISNGDTENIKFYEL